MNHAFTMQADADPSHFFNLKMSLLIGVIILVVSTVIAPTSISFADLDHERP
jgi:hypothetical protein